MSSIKKNQTTFSNDSAVGKSEETEDLSVDSLVLAPLTSGDWEVGMYFVTLDDFINQVFRNYVSTGEARFDNLDTPPDLAHAGQNTRLKNFCVVRVTAAQARRLRQILNTQGQNIQLYALVGDEVYPGSLVPKQASLFMDFTAATALLSPVMLAEVRSGQSSLHASRTGNTPLENQLDSQLKSMVEGSADAEVAEALTESADDEDE